MHIRRPFTGNYIKLINKKILIKIGIKKYLSISPTILLKYIPKSKLIVAAKRIVRSKKKQKKKLKVIKRWNTLTYYVQLFSKLNDNKHAIKNRPVIFSVVSEELHLRDNLTLRQRHLLQRKLRRDSGNMEIVRQSLVASFFV